jgi:hypothetical protein
VIAKATRAAPPVGATAARCVSWRGPPLTVKKAPTTTGVAHGLLDLA